MILFSAITRKTTEMHFQLKTFVVVYIVTSIFPSVVLSGFDTSIALSSSCARCSKAKVMARLPTCSCGLFEKAPSALALADFICPIHFCWNITWAASDRWKQLEFLLRKVLIAQGKSGLLGAWIPAGSGKFSILYRKHWSLGEYRNTGYSRH